MTNRHAPSNVFVLRTPLLPIDALLSLSSGLMSVHVSGSELASAVDADRRLVLGRLGALFRRPEIEEALFIASPDAFAACGALQGPPNRPADAAVACTAMRYFARMVGRCTPYGLFAGCSVGTLDRRTALTLRPQAKWRRRSRLDSDYVYSLASHLAGEDWLRRDLTYRPNTSIYRIGGYCRWVFTVLEGRARRHRLMQAEATEDFLTVFAGAAGGCGYRVLVERLVESAPDEIAADEAAAYIDKLIDVQVLVPDVIPPVTGAEPLESLRRALALCPAATDVGNILTLLQADLAAADAEGIGVPTDRYRAIAARLTSLPVRVNPSRLVQVDLFKPMQEATLAQDIVDELHDAIELLCGLNAIGESESLHRFRQAFRDRYDAQEVRLVDALDEETGIGFDPVPNAEIDPLLGGLELPPPLYGSTVTVGPLHRLLLRRLVDALWHRTGVISLSRAEVEAVRSQQVARLPDAFGASAIVGCVSDNDGRTHTRIVLKSAVGPSGARLLGRFCHVDAAIEAAVRGHLRAEEASRPDARYAEIVHLPEGRLANVLIRPVLRSFEIPFLGHSGAPADKQLAITDLLISIIGDRIVLRSAQLDCEVLPRLTTAHNYSRGVGLYRFLCALQSQNAVESIGWTWGALEQAPFLPRVELGCVVLSRARWLLSADLIRSFSVDSPSDAFRAVQAWRAAWHVPRFVYLADGDNELLTDFDNVLSVETFVDLIRGRPSAIVVEMFPSPDDLAIAGADGRFVNEIIISFATTQTVVHVRPATPEPAPSHPRRIIPGSDWIYVKIYAGGAAADRILTGMLGPVIRRLLAQGAIDRWFFVRYSDPEKHLRVRLHGEPSALESVARLLKPALDEAVRREQAWRVQYDTYTRELERYGGAAGIDASESLFYIDSVAAQQIIELVQGDLAASLRWRLCVRSFDVWLADFGFDVSQKYQFVTKALSNFPPALRQNKTLKIQLGARFRNERESLERLLESSASNDDHSAAALQLLAHRSNAATSVVAQLRSLEVKGLLTCPVSDLLPSYLHMSGNRLLRTFAPEHEFVVFDFLRRLYASRLARAG
jgi:class I lanthipeptide synthase